MQTGEQETERTKIGKLDKAWHEADGRGRGVRRVRTGKGNSRMSLSRTLRYRNEEHSAKRAGKLESSLRDKASLDWKHGQLLILALVQSNRKRCARRVRFQHDVRKIGTHRSSLFMMMSTTSSGSFCILFPLKSIVRPGFSALLISAPSPTCWSACRKASCIASRASAIT